MGRCASVGYDLRGVAAIVLTMVQSHGAWELTQTILVFLLLTLILASGRSNPTRLAGGSRRSTDAYFARLESWLIAKLSGDWCAICLG